MSWKILATLNRIKNIFIKYFSLNLMIIYSEKIIVCNKIVKKNKYMRKTLRILGKIILMTLILEEKR